MSFLSPAVFQLSCSSLTRWNSFAGLQCYFMHSRFQTLYLPCFTHWGQRSWHTPQALLSIQSQIHFLNNLCFLLITYLNLEPVSFLRRGSVSVLEFESCLRSKWTWPLALEPFLSLHVLCLPAFDNDCGPFWLRQSCFMWSVEEVGLIRSDISEDGGSGDKGRSRGLKEKVWD